MKPREFWICGKFIYSDRGQALNYHNSQHIVHVQEVVTDVPKCTHPKEKVRMHYKKLTDIGGVYKNFECECGSIVQPKEFEEVK